MNDDDLTECRMLVLSRDGKGSFEKVLEAIRIATLRKQDDPGCTGLVHDTPEMRVVLWGQEEH